ncbi:Peroxisomal membrane protein PEX13 [Strongyloides ratti]|uniref:Peroxisomal membrane protein PEX13 n=1 Tax=Strongyloides ratti TaxID=34506 RepID=A0A090LVB3_STRRB|nr:Peroxisomal membrane protein PEX13 [Strongyloides ratti]CEF71604.1 Peroxisomal membrane protein PEX13 [Strongyloides ratti]
MDPPALPPRPNQFIGNNNETHNGVYSYNSTLGYNGLNNPYGIGYNNIYPYNNMHNLFNGGNYNYSGITPESNFVRLAEESSRGAFQSIESIVNAVASVAHMLSSTHNALFSSFRAVIGVVEQFSKLKVQLIGVLETFFIFKFIKKLWKYILVKLELLPESSLINDTVWKTPQKPLKANEWIAKELSGHTGNGVNWPALLFWIIAIGGPWLIYKFVTRMVNTIEESRKWATGNSDHYTATGLYTFQGNTSNHELSFNKGDILRVAPKNQQPPIRGWLLASSEDGTRIGLVPINYIKLERKTTSPPTLQNIEDNLFEKIKESTIKKNDLYKSTFMIPQINNLPCKST